MTTQRTAAATAARRIPEGYKTDRYQIVLSSEIVEVFSRMNPRERGALVEKALLSQTL